MTSVLPHRPISDEDWPVTEEIKEKELNEDRGHCKCQKIQLESRVRAEEF